MEPISRQISNSNLRIESSYFILMKLEKDVRDFIESNGRTAKDPEN
jgi:hypothetical protein